MTSLQPNPMDEALPAFVSIRPPSDPLPIEEWRTQMPESPEESIRRAVANFNSRDDRRACVELYAPDCKLFGFPIVSSGREAILNYLDQVWGAFPDMKLTLEDLVIDAEKAVMRFEVIGTHHGVFMGISPTGRRIRLTGMIMFRFQNGKCVECWHEVNFMSLLQQAGIIPTL